MGRSRPTSQVHGAVPGASRRMRFNFVRRSPQNVYVTAIRLPAGHAGSEMLVGISEPSIVLFLVGIIRRFGFRIAPTPENFNESLPLFIGGELEKSSALVLGNNVRYFIAQP